MVNKGAGEVVVEGDEGEPNSWARGEGDAHRMRRPASGPERKLMDCPIVDAVWTPSTPSASFIAAFFAKRRQSQNRAETQITTPTTTLPRTGTSPLPSSRLSRVNPGCQFSGLLVVSSLSGRLGWSLGRAHAPGNYL